jgi:hypothetical protein
MPIPFARCSRIVTVLLVALCVAAATPVRAQPAAPATPSADDAERAHLLKQRGDEAMDALRYADALAAYKQAFEITHNPALYYNQARAHQGLGDFAAAYDFLERFDAEAPADLKARVPQLQRLIDDVRSRVARLTVRCNVSGAQVVLGSTVIGTTPIAREIRTNSGRVKLEVTAEGYRPFTRDLELPGGGATTVTADLLRKDASAVLAVTSNAPGASVWLDGKPIGQAPIEVVAGSGSHELKLERQGYEPASSSVVLAVGEHKQVSITMLQPTPLTAKWWFWTGVGVVVVGATATVIALTTERGADSGTVAPGRVTAPLLHW